MNLYLGEFPDPPTMIEVMEKAAQLLGTAPPPLDEALPASFAWHRTQPRRLEDYTFEDQLLSHR